MLTTSTKKRMRQAISVMVMVAMVLGFGGLSAAKSFAITGGGGTNPIEIPGMGKQMRVTDYSGLGMQYAMSKTVDLSDTDVDVTITPAEREAILKKVGAEAETYIEKVEKNRLLYYFESITGSYKSVVNDGRSLVVEDKPYVRIAKGQWEEDVKENNSTSMYHSAVEGIASKSESVKVFFDVIDAIYAVYESDGCEYKADNPAYADIADSLLEGNVDKDLIEWKTQELYNNEIGDLFVERLGSQLNAKFSFSVVPLAEDGSEDAVFGVDGTTIKRGTFKEGVTEMPFSQIDFGAKGQVYDEILMEDMGRIIAGETDEGENNRDGRDALTRALVFDMGQLTSSDDSQYSWGVNMKRSLEDGWEGWHMLLEVADSLATYDVFTPDWSYIRTFNLHLNPSVIYVADFARADLITGTEFDDSGKLVSITKPIMPANENSEKRVDYLKPVYDRLGDYFDESANGVYRFKLVESQIDPVELPNGAKFNDNNEEKIFDLAVKDGNITISLYEDPSGYGKYQEAVAKMKKAYDDLLSGKATMEEYMTSIDDLRGVFLQGLPAFTNSVTKEEEPTTPTTKPDGDGTPDGTPDKEVSQKTPTDTPVDMDGGTDKDSGDSDKGGKGSKTGDSTNMIIPGLLALLALVTGGSVAIRRRRMDH